MVSITEKKAADLVKRAIAAAIAEGKNITCDMNYYRVDSSAVGASQVADAVIEKLVNIPLM